MRGGVVNPLMRLPRSNLLTVGYRIHDGYLERLAWPLTDAAGSVKPTTQKLIPADSLRLQFYDGTLAGELVISAGDSCGSTHNPAFATMGRN